MRSLDPLVRMVFRLGFRAARLTWRIRRPSHEGALVALWVGDRVLAVRQSYQSAWTFPGGGVRRGEAPIAAAVRELEEETGVVLGPNALALAGVCSSTWHHRNDRVHVFEARLEATPWIALDGRELVEARWLAVAELLELELAPHVRAYAQGNSVSIAHGAAGEARR